MPGNNLPATAECATPSTLSRAMQTAIERGGRFPGCTSREAADAAARILGCYPSGKPADPKTYTAAIVGVLMEYPIEAVRAVSDPVRGIPRKSTFLPSVAEVAVALDEEMRPYRAAWRRAMNRRGLG